MVNGYGIFLIAWLFVQFIFKVFRYYKTEKNPTAFVAGAATQLAITIWLISKI